MGTPITYDQYVDLRSEYRAMMEELNKYNEYRATQPEATAPKQYPQRSNPQPEQSDFQEAQTSSESWKPQYSSTERSSGASEPVSTKNRRRKSHTDQADLADHVTKVELANVMRELQQLKKVRLGPDFDPDVESNPLSLAIQLEPINPTIRIPKERFNGTSDPADHAMAFKSRMDFYGASDATKCRAFSATFIGVARSWYESLPAQSITSFKYFKKSFIGNFMANKRRPKKMTSLWSITQGPNETLESYTERFTATYSCVANPNKDLAIQAFVAGITNENVQLSLSGTDVGDMESLINKAYKLSDT